MENPKAGVRKGAWTKEEDILLTKCIHKFGEGRWHLVPLRSGLNRCRKSCRLRWLNYLNPNVKRGLFTQDEVDLIMRMHKLLGNRWSLIAGRIPGRTANDIKNFWNTHIQKNSSSPVASHLQKTNKASDETECSNNINNNNNNNNVIIRPQPRNMRISSSNNLTENEIPTNTNTQQLHDDHEVEECMRWWADLLNTCSSEKDSGPFSFPEDKAQQPMLDLMNHRSTSIDNDGGYDLDVDAMWELLNMDV